MSLYATLLPFVSSSTTDDRDSTGASKVVPVLKLLGGEPVILNPISGIPR